MRYTRECAYSRAGRLLRKPKGPVAALWKLRLGLIAPEPQGIRSVMSVSFDASVWSLFGGLYASFVC